MVDKKSSTENYTSNKDVQTTFKDESKLIKDSQRVAKKITGQQDPTKSLQYKTKKKKPLAQASNLTFATTESYQVLPSSQATIPVLSQTALASA